MDNYSICGINCSICKHKAENKCIGCRANEGRIFWGECDLYRCCIGKNKENCGECSIFPCDKLKEWASNENPERIQNLIELKNKKNEKYKKLLDKDGKVIYWLRKKAEKMLIFEYLQSKFEKGKNTKKKR